MFSIALHICGFAFHIRGVSIAYPWCLLCISVGLHCISVVFGSYVYNIDILLSALHVHLKVRGVFISSEDKIHPICLPSLVAYQLGELFLSVKVCVKFIKGSSHLCLP